VTKSVWIVAIALVGVALVIYFRSEIWYVLTYIAFGIWYVMKFIAFGIWYILKPIAVGIWLAFGAGIELARSLLNYIAAFVIVVVALIIGVTCIVIPLRFLIRYIIGSLNEIAKQVSNLNFEFREEAVANSSGCGISFARRYPLRCYRVYGDRGFFGENLDHPIFGNVRHRLGCRQDIFLLSIPRRER
jgi:hypothetical protein